MKQNRNMFGAKCSFLTLAVLAVLPAIAPAQTTGTLVGVVYDKSKGKTFSDRGCGGLDRQTLRAHR